MELDIHIVPPNNAKKIIRQMEKLIKKMRSHGKLNKKTSVSIGIKERQTPYIEPYVTSKESPIVKQILAIIRENFGNPIINYSSSVADDNIIANSLDIPVITIGPSGGNEHASNEWVSARSLNDLSKLYSMILKISN
jgi:acetylornithine deacetylase/succinyl-diaminopimelate desuccinylase-like protein